TFAELGARGDLERVRGRRRDSGPRTGPRVDLAGVLAGVGDALRHGDVDAATGVLVDRVLEASSYERGFVLSLDDEGRPHVLLRRVRRGARGFDRGDVEFSGTIVRRVAATGMPVAVGDAALDAALREQRSVIALGLRRITCAPLQVGGRVVGVVYLDAASVLADGPDLDVGELEAVAASLALLVDRARLAGDAARTRELMSILAHEIRNPLAGIMGYSEMCMDPELESATRLEMIGRVHGDAGRMARLVENVLELTRHERGNMEWSMTAIDVAALVEETTRGYLRQCERRGQHLRMEIASPSTGLGNHDRLVQVVSNLLSNALKFTPSGGTITVAVRREAVRAGDPAAPPAPATDLRAWVPAEPGDLLGDFIRVDVRDTGPGMTPELLANLFAKFTQAPGATRARGIGLGLYISREIVRRHGGSIWVESELGKGATFSFRIPVAL
ncbi:MAG: HAMP domain-containing histidine kinase, partial [Myxococcales bacterium]|nr:HAMP domain-containing histidine kinase [Myxococcales bacterium]